MVTHKCKSLKSCSSFLCVLQTFIPKKSSLYELNGVMQHNINDVARQKPHKSHANVMHWWNTPTTLIMQLFCFSSNPGCKKKNPAELKITLLQRYVTAVNWFIGKIKQFCIILWIIVSIPISFFPKQGGKAPFFSSGCSIYRPLKWALSLPYSSSGRPVPAAPVTPHGEDVLPAISPLPALQQCRDALTKHAEDIYRTRSRRPPCGHYCRSPRYTHRNVNLSGTVWGQSVGIDKDYSLRHIVFHSISCLQGRAPLSLTLCYWYKRRGSSAASLLRCWPKEPT